MCSYRGSCYDAKGRATFMPAQETINPSATVHSYRGFPAPSTDGGALLPSPRSWPSPSPSRVQRCDPVRGVARDAARGGRGERRRTPARSSGEAQCAERSDHPGHRAVLPEPRRGGGGWLRTGDLEVEDEEGYLSTVGGSRTCTSRVARPSTPPRWSRASTRIRPWPNAPSSACPTRSGSPGDRGKGAVEARVRPTGCRDGGRRCRRDGGGLHGGG